MTGALTDNPYEAPAVFPLPYDDSEANERLSIPFGQYRIKDGRLLISGDVQLPEICVRTGETVGLVSQTATVWFRSLAEDTVGFVVGGIVMIGFLFAAEISILLAVHAKIPYPVESVFTVASLCLLGATIGSRGFKTESRSLVKISYYESIEWQAARSQRIRRAWTTVVVIFVIATAAVWWWFDSPALLPAAICVAAFALQCKIVCAVRHRDGVFIVIGVPTEFLSGRHYPWCEL